MRTAPIQYPISESFVTPTSFFSGQNSHNIKSIDDYKLNPNKFNWMFKDNFEEGKLEKLYN
jgi:hypothetical protein